MCREAYLLYRQKLNRQNFKMDEDLYYINAPWNTHWSMSFTLPCVYSKRRALHRIGFVESNKYSPFPAPQLSSYFPTSCLLRKK